MKKTDITYDQSGLKAANAFIFAGSFSLGVMEAGFDLLKVLEISNSQLNENAFYFKKNVEDVPVVLPDEWENDAYLNALQAEEIDLMCCNCPCSSLSQINRNASIDGKNNVHFYRLFNVFERALPKVFVIENAPTLIKLGFPILKSMVQRLSSKYLFTIVRDYAGNHDVPMARQRTILFGWRKDVFSKIPVVEQDAKPHMLVKDALANCVDKTPYVSSTTSGIEDLYKYAMPGFSLMTSLAKHWIADGDEFKSMLEKRLDGTSHLREVKRIASKIEKKQNCWDKSPYKLALDGRFPSFTSVSEYLHPTEDRMLSLQEMAAIMNYPSWYDFSDVHHECKIPVAQAIAQGVPANFGKYVAQQARKALEGKLQLIDEDDACVSFQHHSKHMRSSFTYDEFCALGSLELKDSPILLEA